MARPHTTAALEFLNEEVFEGPLIPEEELALREQIKTILENYDGTYVDVHVAWAQRVQKLLLTLDLERIENNSFVS